ncbi:MAG: CsgE family curli-type amyloid fiber assembly protein [Pseudomonadota bacterium]
MGQARVFRSRKLIILALTILFGGMPAFGFDDGVLETPDDRNLDDQEGLGRSLISRAVSPFGNRFYRELASLLRAEGPLDYGIITIDERPWRRGSTIIQVKHSRELVFQALLSPQGNEPAELAKAALDNLERIIAARRAQSGQQSSHPDLAEEEL